MPTPYARRQQNSRREVELQRRNRASADDSGKKTTHDRGVGQPAPPDRRRAAATTCGWCLGTITPKSRGPVPNWCSASCRQRAWEQRRAASSGLSAVEVVERVVEVPAPPKAPPKPRHQEWHGILRELARQLDDGLVYDRHLAGISIEVRKVTTALRSRGTWGDTGSATSPRTGEWTRWPVDDRSSPLIPPGTADGPPSPVSTASRADPRGSRMTTNRNRTADRLHDIDSAAAYLRCGRRLVYRLVAERKLTHTKAGRSLRFWQSDLDAYLDAGTVHSTGQSSTAV